MNIFMYTMKFVTNLTYVDDKIIKKANEENISTDVVAEKYSKAFFEDTKRLGIQESDA